MDIKKIILEGENIGVEFKSFNFDNKKKMSETLTKEAVALTNTNGGIILVGVEDDGTISGCDESYDVQLLLESVYDRTVPRLFLDEERIVMDNKVIFVLKVPKSNQLISTTEGTIYKRLGKNSKPLYPDNYPSQNKFTSNKDVSALIIDNASINDLDFKAIQNLKQRVELRNAHSTIHLNDDLSFLKDFKLIYEVEGSYQITMAGILFVGKVESIKKYIPQAMIQFLIYNENPNEYELRHQLVLPIIELLDKLEEIISLYNKITNVQIGLHRLEVYDYLPKVIQEALLNAIAHRDYQSLSSINIKLYKNELNIENPGSFPEGITIDNIITHPSTPRNKVITDILHQLKYVQSAGQGVDLLFRDTIAYGKQSPIYTIYDESISLKLYSMIEDLVLIKFIVKEQEENGLLSTAEIRIIKFIRMNHRISFDDLCKEAQVDEYSITSIIHKLEKERVIIQKEKTKCYSFTHRVLECLDDTIEYTKNKKFDEIRGKEMILEYLKDNDFITRKDIERLCGFSSSTSKRIITLLLESKKIIMIGQARSTKYELRK